MTKWTSLGCSIYWLKVFKTYIQSFDHQVHQQTHHILVVLHSIIYTPWRYFSIIPISSTPISSNSSGASLKELWPLNFLGSQRLMLSITWWHGRNHHITIYWWRYSLSPSLTARPWTFDSFGHKLSPRLIIVACIAQCRKISLRVLHTFVNTTPFCDSKFIFFINKVAPF